MIILGDRYTFSKLELTQLKKQFATINHISYRTTSAKKSMIIIEDIISSTNTKIIILNTKATLPPKLLTYLTKLEIKGIKYITIEHCLERYLHKCFITKESKDVAFLEDIQPYSPFQYFQKRVIDAIGIIILFPPTLLAIIYSKYRIDKESPGELFFRQFRVGMGEHQFCCIKLRSMHPNAEKHGAQFACKDDPRTFPWGKIIRHTKIDELLQLWNVLKGEMHLVGPRPERRIWTQEFEKSIPFYSKRHIVSPGITGLAQIEYHYGAGELDAEQKLMYDLFYIKNWSLKLELKIIWKTVLFILGKRKKHLLNF